MTPVFNIKIKNGRFDWKSDHHKNMFATYLQGLEGKDVVLKVEQPKKVRSMSQNAYYWVYLGIVAEDTGDSAADLHEMGKRKFLSPKFIKVGEEEMKIPRSTTDLSKQEFSDYLERMCEWTGIELPDPESVGYINN